MVGTECPSSYRRIGMRALRSSDARGGMLASHRFRGPEQTNSNERFIFSGFRKVMKSAVSSLFLFAYFGPRDDAHAV
jgi:hypothetical protein